jgi:hypothetical protein
VAKEGGYRARPLTVLLVCARAHIADFRTFSEHPPEMLYGRRLRFHPWRLRWPQLAIAYVALPRICEFARRLHQLHQLGDDDAIDQEFSAVCRAIWGFTLDDFTDDDLFDRREPDDLSATDALNKCTVMIYKCTVADSVPIPSARKANSRYDYQAKAPS